MNREKPSRQSQPTVHAPNSCGPARRWVWAGGMIPIMILFLGLCGRFALRWVPLPAALFVPPPAQLELTDRHGTPLRTVRPPDRPFGRPVTCREIPQALIDATLAAEDKRFWHHPGVDWRSSLRAAWSLVRHRRIVSGGSTITQQLIKLAQPRPRTFRSKFVEALQALRLEQVWDKERILTEYLNRIDYGNFNAGCAAAVEFYWGKPLRDLSTAECALLAGLPQAPGRLNPLRHWEQARKRQQWILRRMLETRRISRDEYERAKDEPLRLASPSRAFQAPHFVDLLLREWRVGTERFDGRSAVGAGGNPYPIRTTLDLNLNRRVQEMLTRQVAGLNAQRVGNAAAVVIDNRSGGVLVLVGSENYFAPQAGQVNGAWTPRSAGSSLKPFTYLIAFEQGATPASVVADVRTEFATATGIFSPVNYDRHCRGPVRYRLALANSLNIAAVRVLASIGGPAVLQSRLQACGLTTLTRGPEHYGLGLTIGNVEVRLIELANAYACLARLGEFKPYTLVHLPGGLPPTTQPRTRRIFDSAASYLIADILSDNAARTLAFGAESSLRFDFPVACKTGTSSNFRDNWALAYTPEFTVGVWVGNFDGSPMQQISGVTGAAPLMHDIVEHLHQRFGMSWYPKPSNIVELAIHPVTGKRLSSDTARSANAPLFEEFQAGQLPPAESPADYDDQGRVRLAPEYRDWFASSDNWLFGHAVVTEQNTPLKIVFPLPGTRLFLDPDLPGEGRRIRLQSAGPPGARWSSDTLSCEVVGGQAIAVLQPGHHRLRVRDPHSDLTAETSIEVLQR